MKTYKYGKATIGLETKDIKEDALKRRTSRPEDVPEEFEFDVELRYTEEAGARFFLYVDGYGSFHSHNIDGPIGVTFSSLEEMFDTLSFDKAIETVNAVMKTLTGNDPEVTES